MAKLDPTMMLEDVALDIEEFLDDIFEGRLDHWSDDRHADVQSAAQELRACMRRLKEDATSRPEREFIPLEAAE